MVKQHASVILLLALAVIVHIDNNFVCGEAETRQFDSGDTGSDVACSTESTCCVGGLWQSPCNTDAVWSDWSVCVGDCSGGTRKRGRQVCCPDPDDYDDCLIKCDLPPDAATEAENCTSFCCPQGGCFESNICYPGRCGFDGCSYCECASDFAGESCRTITQPPSTEGCSAVVWSGTEPAEGALVVPCEFPGPVTRSTRIPLEHIDLTWNMKFDGPNITLYPLPTQPYEYVDEFHVGIIKAQLDIVTHTGIPHNTGNITEYCPGNPSPEQPISDFINCSHEINLGTDWYHDNSVRLDLVAESGGHITVSDKPEGLQCTKRYSQEATGRTITIHHDVHNPIHTNCPGCDVIDITSDVYTKSNVVTASWEGWQDSPAGIGGYQLSAYKLEVQPDQSLAAPAHAVVQMTFDVSSNTGSINLPGPGMYSVILTISDQCEPVANQQIARRFVLYDDVSHVIAVPWQSLVVVSATPDTDWTWIITTSDGHDANAALSVMWGNHFENRIQLDNSWLNNILAHNPSVPTEYDLLTGQPPEFRSAQRVVNARGIIRWEVLVVRNPTSVDELTNPDPGAAWDTVTIFDYDPMSGTVPVARSDGDVLAFVVRGYDVIDNFHNSYVISYVDSSSPLLEDFRFTDDGEVVHNVTHPWELFDIKLEFAAIDLHSGLLEVSWELRDRSNNLLHGSGTAPVRTHAGGSSTCHLLQHCYCTAANWGDDCYYFNYEIQPGPGEIHITPGHHLYYYTVTVTNHAKLVTTEEHDLPVG